VLVCAIFTSRPSEEAREREYKIIPQKAMAIKTQIKITNGIIIGETRAPNSGIETKA